MLAVRSRSEHGTALGLHTPSCGAARSNHACVRPRPSGRPTPFPTPQALASCQWDLAELLLDAGADPLAPSRLPPSDPDPDPASAPALELSTPLHAALLDPGGRGAGRLLQRMVAAVDRVPLRVNA
jgi:hypothetical protein